jgi:hypothetical protein
MSPLPHSFTSSTYRLSNQISIINGSIVIEWSNEPPCGVHVDVCLLIAESKRIPAWTV